MAYDLSLVTTDQGAMPPALAKKCQDICETEGITPSGLTILGGKPYINVTGLDTKVKQKAIEQGLVYQGLSIEPVACEDKDSGRREYKATITFFDRAGFLSALAGIGQAATPETVKELRQAFTQSFSDVGSASPASVKMSTMKNADNIAMMASRRATNRAKRAATGTGLTSIDEVDTKSHGNTPDEIINGKVIDAEPGAVTAEPDPPPPAAPTAKEPPKPSECISEKQQRLLFARVFAGVPSDAKEKRAVLKDNLARLIWDVCGVEHSNQIASRDFEALLKRLPEINPAAGGQHASS